MISKAIYRRDAEVIVNDRSYRGIRVVFDVERTLTPAPNTAEIRLYNLTRAQRGEILRAGKPKVRLSAGYVQTGLTALITGDMRTVENEIDGPDLITKINMGDGVISHKTARIKTTVNPGANAADVINTIAKALGVRPGNVTQIAAALRSGRSSDIYTTGTVLSGAARDEMTQLCRSCGLEWSIQDGALQVLPVGSALAGKAVLLSPSTGLIGSPSIDSRGACEVKALLIPGLIPGRIVAVESRLVSGQYRIEEIRYSGDTHGQDWYATIRGRTPTAITLGHR